MLHVVDCMWNYCLYSIKQSVTIQIQVQHAIIWLCVRLLTLYCCIRRTSNHDLCCFLGAIQSSLNWVYMSICDFVETVVCMQLCCVSRVFVLLLLFSYFNQLNVRSWMFEFLNVKLWAMSVLLSLSLADFHSPSTSYQNALLDKLAYKSTYVDYVRFASRWLASSI